MKLGVLIPVMFLVLGSFQIQDAHGANILFFIGFGSYSHRTPIQPLVDALADKGHNVTFLSPFPAKTPNPKVKEVTPPKIKAWIDRLIGGGELDVYKARKNYQILMVWMMLPSLGVQACEHLYSDPEFLSWMKSSQFDLVVMDPLVNECAYGMAHYFKAKLISFNTAIMYVWNLESYYGIPDETSSIPDGMMHMPAKMNFFERAITALTPFVWKVYRDSWFFPKLEEITRNGLGIDDLPSFVEIEKNTSLVLLNSHYSHEYPRSLPPNVIPVGGIAWHGKQKPLPKRLEDFINKGKEGFIFVSFGTVAEFTLFDPEVREAFIRAIHKFPQVQFIWKSTFPIVEKLPENVLVEKWLPQIDILAHPKIRMYVTHGGLGGIYEAIMSKVPMICFPVFAEQEYNADLMVEKGYGIKMELIGLKEEEVTKAIQAILTNKSYKKQVEKVAQLFTDRPMSPLDTAMWWVEYVLRHGDTSEFLRPLSVHQSWWVRRQLDVWAAVLVVIMIALSIPLLLLRCVLRRVCGSGAKAKSNIKEKRS